MKNRVQERRAGVDLQGGLKGVESVQQAFGAGRWKAFGDCVNDQCLLAQDPLHSCLLELILNDDILFEHFDVPVDCVVGGFGEAFEEDNSEFLWSLDVIGTDLIGHFSGDVCIPLSDKFFNKLKVEQHLFVVFVQLETVLGVKIVA